MPESQCGKTQCQNQKGKLLCCKHIFDHIKANLADIQPKNHQNVQKTHFLQKAPGVNGLSSIHCSCGNASFSREVKCTFKSRSIILASLLPHYQNKMFIKRKNRALLTVRRSQNATKYLATTFCEKTLPGNSQDWKQQRLRDSKLAQCLGCKRFYFTSFAQRGCVICNRETCLPCFKEKRSYMYN